MDQDPPFDLRSEVDAAFAVAKAAASIRDYFVERPWLAGTCQLANISGLSDSDLEQFVAKAVQVTSTKSLTDAQG